MPKCCAWTPRGKTTTVFESQELAAQALAVDAAGNLFVGTSPDGKVYKVTPSGQSSVFFDPKTKYIWDLAVDKDGTLYVATGDTGKIFVVAPDGKGQVFYSSEETHIRSLALDSSGNVLAGTEPSGLVLRIPKAAGNPRARSCCTKLRRRKSRRCCRMPAAISTSRPWARKRRQRRDSRSLRSRSTSPSANFTVTIGRRATTRIAADVS